MQRGRAHQRGDLLVGADVPDDHLLAPHDLAPPERPGQGQLSGAVLGSVRPVQAVPPVLAEVGHHLSQDLLRCAVGHAHLPVRFRQQDPLRDGLDDLLKPVALGGRRLRQLLDPVPGQRLLRDLHPQQEDAVDLP